MGYFDLSSAYVRICSASNLTLLYLGLIVLFGLLTFRDSYLSHVSLPFL